MQQVFSIPKSMKKDFKYTLCSTFEFKSKTTLTLSFVYCENLIAVITEFLILISVGP